MTLKKALRDRQGPGRHCRKLSLNFCVIQIYWKYRIYWFPDFRFTYTALQVARSLELHGVKEKGSDFAVQVPWACSGRSNHEVQLLSHPSCKTHLLRAAAQLDPS